LLRTRDENEVEKTLEERFRVEFDFGDVGAECNQMMQPNLLDENLIFKAYFF